MQDVQTIDSNAALLALCGELQAKPLIALDTEFIRVSTFFPKPGLIQLYDGEQFALIDPLGIDQWQPFSALLENQNIVKIFHACSEDIELLYHTTGAEACNVFDTQVAAALVGMDYSMGYQRLVSALIGIDLPKVGSRSDWLKRPLSEEQIHYALDDVRYLPDMYQLLATKLNEASLEDAMTQEYEQVMVQVLDREFAQAYKRVSLAWQLKGDQFGRLKALATFREKLMRRLDLPRKHIATNDALMLLAQTGSWQKQAFLQVKGLSINANKAYSEEWLQILQTNFSGHAALGRPEKADKRFKVVKQALKQLAEESSIAESILIKKAYFSLLCQALKQNDLSVMHSISPWRRPFYDKVFHAHKPKKV